MCSSKLRLISSSSIGIVLEPPVLLHVLFFLKAKTSKNIGNKARGFSIRFIIQFRHQLIDDFLSTNDNDECQSMIISIETFLPSRKNSQQILKRHGDHR